jgi:hypothetical protein
VVLVFSISTISTVVEITYNISHYLCFDTRDIKFTFNNLLNLRIKSFNEQKKKLQHYNIFSVVVYKISFSSLNIKHFLDFFILIIFPAHSFGCHVKDFFYVRMNLLHDLNPTHSFSRDVPFTWTCEILYYSHFVVIAIERNRCCIPPRFSR